MQARPKRRGWIDAEHKASKCPEFEVGDYIIETAQDYLDVEGLIARFSTITWSWGRPSFLFDSENELPDPGFRRIVRDKIRALLRRYPGNTTLATSCIVGYEK